MTVEQLTEAIKRYARCAPLDLKGPCEIQTDLLGIAGEPHRHQSSVRDPQDLILGNGSCFLCGRDERNIIHLGKQKCETCDGTGRINTDNNVVTDGGTRWRRTAVELVETECPTCNGEKFSD